MNSRSKGKRGELDFIQSHLIEFWPKARRNLDQFTIDKRDALDCGDLHWQIKYTERLAIWAAIRQSEEESEGRHSLVAFRRNRTPWYVAGRADLIVPVLAEVDHAA